MKRLFLQGRDHVLDRDSVGHASFEPVVERIRVSYDALCTLALVEPLAVGSRPLILDVVCNNAPMIPLLSCSRAMTLC